MTFEQPALLWLLIAAPIAGAVLLRRRRTELGAIRNALLSLTVAASVALAVLAAAAPRRADDRAPDVRGAVVADISASMGASGLARVNEVLKATDRDPAAAATLVYAKSPRPLDGGSVATLAGESDGSNPAAALESASAALGTNGPRRVFLVSDGGQTEGDVVAAAERLAAAGVAVDVQLAGDPRPFSIASVEAAGVSGAGERTAVRARVAAASTIAVTVALSADGKEVATRDVTLEPGEQAIDLSWRAGKPGVHPLLVTVSAEGLAPDRVELPIEVLPAPRTLLVSNGASPVQNALGEAGIGANRITPDTFPADLRGFDAVILDGVEAEALGTANVAVLGSFVRGGGGLVAVPGDKGLAKGGADAAKALRRLLPLATVDDEKKEPPPVGIVFILDRSDSMHRERKWEAAAKTTASAYYDLNQTSTVGLLVFSDFSDWKVKPTKVKDVPEFPKIVAAIQLTGGTNMFPAVKEAYEALAPLDVRKKHIVLLSDGVSLSRIRESRKMLKEMAAAKITVSTVALGSEADQVTMAEVARITGGRYWYVQNPDDLPRIFAEETKRTQMVDDEVPIAALEKKEIAAFASLDPTKSGWSGTTHARTRGTSETLWQLDAPDTAGGARQAKRPLLARGRLGAGRAVALAAPIQMAPVSHGELAAAMLRASVAPAAEALGVRAESRRLAEGTRVSLARLEPGTLAAGWSVEVLDAAGTVERRVTLAPDGTDRASAVVEHADARLGRVLTPDGRPAAWVRLTADRAERSPWPESLGAIASATGGVVVPEGTLPAWLGRVPPKPERPWSVPLGLAALFLAALGVWIRRPRVAVVRA